MPAKIARSTPRRSFVLPEMTVADQTSLLSCRKAAKARIFEYSSQIGSHLGEPKFTPILTESFDDIIGRAKSLVSLQG